ncbi:serine/threonine-protein kinase [Streptomyces sp. KLOTTS4A1]|uniref:serine/threonine-protein kinase n=1 Tax=Streptomyces sp. KLOTTS4A1 TaxID=3390996 RepID=UPI0039F476B9
MSNGEAERAVEGRVAEGRVTEGRVTEGRVVDGRFVLEERLGGGGMGTVWRARDLVLDRAVALKEVRPPDPALAEYDPEAARLLRARVLREARALARVEHPDVVTIHHIVDGGEGTYPWLVMELVTGGSLADRLSEGPMAPAEAARLGRGVLAGLRAAHEAGIEHRDVKPANVLLRPDGRPVLTDFGIAAIRESTVLTATGSVIGTPDYMAPERVSGGEGGPAADLWSLAMMLYAAVEGRHPLRRANTLATLAAVLNDEIPPPRRADALTPVLTAALVRDPAARPGAEEMDRMLARVAGAGREAGASGAAGAGRAVSAAEVVDAAEAARVVGSDGASEATEDVHTDGAVGPAGAVDAGKDSEASSVSDVAGSSDAAAPTSYPLAPPAVPQAAEEGHGTAQGARRSRRRAVVGASLVGTLLAGVLVWSFLPEEGAEAGAGKRPSGASTGTGTGTGTGTPTGDASPDASPRVSPDVSPSASPAGTAKAPAPGQTDLLTSEGIRTAVAALQAESGSDRFASLVVYPEFASARIMLKGDDKRYDTWTFRAGSGAEKSFSGSLGSGDLTFSPDEFDWDVVPGLLAEAGKRLKVKDIDARYLLVRPPDGTFGTPLALSVYLTDAYGVGGYIEADLSGKVTEVMRDED